MHSTQALVENYKNKKETENPLEEFESVIYKPIHVAMFGKRLQKTIMII